MMVMIYKRPFFLATVFLMTITFFLLQRDINTEYPLETFGTFIKINGFNDEEVQKWWADRLQMKPNMSELGKMVFLNEVPTDGDEKSKSKRYKILVWKYGPTIESRHLKHFSDEKVDPFNECSVKNCDITYKDADIDTADLVLFHLHRLKGTKDLPTTPRNLNQIWTFLTDESPYHTFLQKGVKLKDFNGIFNWSMTYRMDSDIPVPYGRTVLRNPTESPLIYKLNKRKDVLVAILGSNCASKNKRWEYVKKLQQYLPVDVYGKCGPLKTCPGHFKSDCKDIDNYMFYLAFENSNCDEYVTEKLWWNAFEKDAIPIVMGSDPANYKRLLPLGSYLDTNDFADPHTLATYLIRINQTGEYEQFFQWKKNFDVLNEHGYFKSKSVHYCRICEALNYNDKKQKIYDKLEDVWSTEKNCHGAWS